jgi:hypothetical protein
MTKKHYILATFIFFRGAVVKQEHYVYGTFVELTQAVQAPALCSSTENSSLIFNYVKSN